jgi:hypothetical protein
MRRALGRGRDGPASDSDADESSEDESGEGERRFRVGRGFDMFALVDAEVFLALAGG